MFAYFENIYPWNLAIVTALDMGAVASDVDIACRPLRKFAGADAPGASAAWADNWSAIGDRMKRQANRDEAEHHLRSAGQKSIRGALYKLLAERIVKPSNPRKLELYREATAMFRRGVEMRGDDAEYVEVSYQRTTLPSIFVKPRAKPPWPCIIHFNGFDWIKEFNYLNLAEEYARHGIASMFCDQPGSGGALRLQRLPARIESEESASACVDYLEKRPEVDRARIGIQGVSLGGYYAPRAAAFEQRLACCVALGAFYDAIEVTQRRAQEGEKYASSVPDLNEQMMWVTGTDSMEGAMKFLAQITLKGVADKITCPLLVTHGGADRQIPVEQAQQTYEAAVNSPSRKLVVLGPEEGGVEHCSIDNGPLVREIACNWIAGVLRARPDVRGF
jgi:dienelactone hydrolase